MGLKISTWTDLSISYAEEDVAFAIEHDSGTIVPTTLGVCLENLFHIMERVILKTSSDDRCGRLASSSAAKKQLLEYHYVSGYSIFQFLDAPVLMKSVCLRECATALRALRRST